MAAIPSSVLARKRVITDILSLIETGHLPSPSAYGMVAVNRDNAGFSLGIHQATDDAGSADAMLLEYIHAQGLYSKQLASFLPYFDRNESKALQPDSKTWPQWAQDFKSFWNQAGFDPVMQECQERVFDRLYWVPSSSLCADLGLVEPLSYLAVYDAWIQSGQQGVARNRMRFPEGPPKGGGSERPWTIAFLKARDAWLRSSTSPALRTSSYRTAELLKLCDAGLWSLTPPFNFRGTQIRG